MSNTVIKRVSDLPKWFTDKSYPNISDEISWAVEIQRRLFFLRLGNGSVNFFGKNEDLFIESIMPYAIYDERWWGDDGTIVDIPPMLYPLDVRKPVDDLYGSDLIHLTATCPQEILTHIDMVRDLIKLDEEVHHDNPKGWVIENYDYIKKRDDTLESIAESTSSATVITNYFDSKHNPYRLLHKPISGRPCLVDVSQDDETLASSFLDWVKIERESMGVSITKKKRKIDNETLFDWNKYRPLQVFDLDYWSQLTGIKITDSVIAKAVWPDDDLESIDIDNVARLRNVTRKSTIPSIICEDMYERLKGRISELMTEK